MLWRKPECWVWRCSFWSQSRQRWHHIKLHNVYNPKHIQCQWTRAQMGWQAAHIMFQGRYPHWIIGHNTLTMKHWLNPTWSSSGKWFGGWTWYCCFTANKVPTVVIQWNRINSLNASVSWSVGPSRPDWNISALIGRIQFEEPLMISWRHTTSISISHLLSRCVVHTRCCDRCIQLWSPDVSFPAGRMSIILLSHFLFPQSLKC